MNIRELRQSRPEYAELPMEVFARKVYDKYYAAKMPIEDFYNKIDLGHDNEASPTDMGTEMINSLSATEKHKASAEVLTNAAPGAYSNTWSPGGTRLMQDQTSFLDSPDQQVAALRFAGDVASVAIGGGTGFIAAKAAPVAVRASISASRAALAKAEAWARANIPGAKILPKNSFWSSTLGLGMLAADPSLENAASILGGQVALKGGLGAARKGYQLAKRAGGLRKGPTVDPRNRNPG